MMQSMEAVVERASSEPDGFECDLEGDLHQLNLWGRFGREWLGGFCLHLFAADIQVVEAEIMKTRAGPWASRFLLSSTDRARLGHDFLHMARRAPRSVPELPMPVVSISVQPSHEEAGHVYANVVGKDSSGFMAHVLDHFHRFGLVPKRCLIRTQDGEVNDWFWLTPVMAPSSVVAAESALEQDWRASPRP